MIKILLLAANPTDTTWLRVDAEAREIDQVLRQSEFRDSFSIEKHFAVRVMDLQGLLLRYEPDIVHFSGHGNTANEIIVEDSNGKSHPIAHHAIGQLFSILNDNVHCVVLNACYSELQAKAIAQQVDCVIGMSTSIGDAAAISFAASFYQALGYGKDVKTAFDLGCLQIDLENLGEQNTPRLLTREGVDPSKVYLVTGEPSSVDATQEIPFAQSHTLYLDSVRKLLKATFHDEASLDAFCRECFCWEFTPGTPFLWKIELLIERCDRNHDLTKLLQQVEAFSDRESSKHFREAAPTNAKLRRLGDSWSSLIKKILQFKLLRRTSTEMARRTAQCELTIQFPFDKFDSETQNAAINALAYELHIPTNQIKVIAMHEGSIILKLQIPDEAFGQLIAMYEANKSALADGLGISYIIETPDEPYRLKNIKSMLVKGFSFEQLAGFWGSNFQGMLGPMPATTDANAIADRLIEHAKLESQIPALLSLAQKWNSKAYDKYRPYYIIPRKPFQGAKSQSTSLKLTRKELIAATTRGLIAAFFGSVLLSMISHIIQFSSLDTGIKSSIDMLINFFAWYYLGNYVGRQVLIGAHNKRDPRLRKIAVTCFVLGCITGPLYFENSLKWIAENRLLELFLSICILPIVVFVLAMVYIFSLNNIGSLVNYAIRIVCGGYSAYRSAR